MTRRGPPPPRTHRPERSSYPGDPRRRPPPVVPLGRVLEERDPVAARREPKVAHVAARLAQDFSYGKLQTILATDLADHRQARAVGRPIRLAHVLENVPRRPALERHPRQCRSEERR